MTNNNIDWNIRHKNMLKGYQITSDVDGTWLVVMKAKTEKHYDVPVGRSDTLNEAIDYAHYFDFAYHKTT